MKIYSKENVFDAALRRVRFLFDEFENVICSFSGGKDSVVMLNIALQVAEEKGRLPLKVLFLDQEAEWQATIDLVKKVMYDKRVEPIWLQVPIKIFNSTSTIEQWLQCWDEAQSEKWIHPKDEISIKENTFGTDRFHEFFTAYMNTTYPNSSAIYLAGVRTEESPTRFVGLTGRALYKHITWGKVLNKKNKQFTFYPLYDWSYTDIWKAIFQNQWPYNKVYDYMYQYGLPVQKMRVSNVHHETAVSSLFYLQEFERETYNRIVDRISGVHAAGVAGEADFFVKDLPYMFASWAEYRDYLVMRIINPDQQYIYMDKFKDMDVKYDRLKNPDHLHKRQVQTILTNDFHFTKLTNWEREPEVHFYRQFHKGKDITKSVHVKDEDIISRRTAKVN